MGWFAVGFGIQVLACATVGVRLLRLARRTREVPELAFGLCFLLLGVVGYPVSVAYLRWIAARGAAAGA